MRIITIISLVLVAPWLLGSQDQGYVGLAGGALILLPVVLIVRGAWLLVGDFWRISRRSGGDRR